MNPFDFIDSVRDVGEGHDPNRMARTNGLVELDEAFRVLGGGFRSWLIKRLGLTDPSYGSLMMKVGDVETWWEEYNRVGPHIGRRTRKCSVCESLGEGIRCLKHR